MFESTTSPGKMDPDFISMPTKMNGGTCWKASLAFKLATRSFAPTRARVSLVHGLCPTHF